MKKRGFKKAIGFLIIVSMLMSAVFTVSVSADNSNVDLSGLTNTKSISSNPITVYDADGNTSNPALSNSKNSAISDENAETFVYDGNVSDTSKRGYILYDLGKLVTVSKIRCIFSGRNVNFSIYASVDGVNFGELYSDTKGVTSGNGVDDSDDTGYIDVGNKEYQYFKFTRKNDTTTIRRIADFEVWTVSRGNDYWKNIDENSSWGTDSVIAKNVPVCSGSNGMPADRMTNGDWTDFGTVAGNANVYTSAAWDLKGKHILGKAKIKYQYRDTAGKLMLCGSNDNTHWTTLCVFGENETSLTNATAYEEEIYFPHLAFQNVKLVTSNTAGVLFVYEIELYEINQSVQTVKSCALTDGTEGVTNVYNAQKINANNTPVEPTYMPLIDVVFNDDVDMSTVKDGLKLYKGDAEAADAQIFIDAENKKASLDIHNLIPACSYAIKTTQNIKTTDGKSSGEWVCNFSTGEIANAAPVTGKIIKNVALNKSAVGVTDVYKNITLTDGTFVGQSGVDIYPADKPVIIDLGKTYEIAAQSSLGLTDYYNNNIAYYVTDSLQASAENLTKSFNGEASIMSDRAVTRVTSNSDFYFSTKAVSNISGRYVYVVNERGYSPSTNAPYKRAINEVMIYAYIDEAQKDKTDISFKAEVTDGKVYVKAVSDNAKDKTLIIAQYSGTALDGIDIINVSNNSQCSTGFEFDASKKYKAFLWNSFEDIKPVLEEIEFDGKEIMSKLLNLN